VGVALLVPQPVAAEVDGLRRACADPSLARVPAHVTLVPPVNVREDRLADAVAIVRSAGDATAGALELELGPAVTFLPDSPVLYLAVGGDVAPLLALRERVFQGPLERPLAWPFVPHVTLADGLTEERLEAAVTALVDYRVTVDVDRVHLLRETGDDHRWVPLAEARFTAPVVVGRGGVELDLRVTAMLDPEAGAFFEAAWTGHLVDSYGAQAPADDPFAITARAAGTVVGVALGTVRDELVLDRLVVAPGHRGQGIGSQLLRAVEDLGAARGVARAVLVVQAGGAAQAFYAARGWRATLDLPSWRTGRDFVQMVRALTPL
jgi:2'-5' RNA ligase/ribosomal protein S18 acetylase RimI-like enzyme